ncbi:MAG: EAL domain-containing response regulator [Leptospirales bacterium]|nr:EAL domain-containing response regulator [Leptospirales bacterium]
MPQRPINDKPCALVIEDHDDMRQSVREILEFEGFAVLEADDGDQGVAIATQSLPDVILCDIGLKQSDGFRVLAAIRGNRRTADIPFIYLTAYATELRRGMELGADDYITKPFDARSLVNSVQMRIQRRREILAGPAKGKDASGSVREIIAALIGRAHNRGRSLALLNADIAFSLGEDEADRQHTFARLGEWLRRLLRRTGGGELLAARNGVVIALLSREASASDLRLVSRTVLHARRFLAARSKHQSVRVRGAVLRHLEQFDDVSDAVRGLEQALQTAMAGDEPCALWTRESDAPPFDLSLLESDIQKAAARNELELHLQPICTPEGKVLGAECLMRWRHPRLGLISPGIFIPLAERCGAIHSLGRWALQSAIEILRELDALHYEGYLSVNLSPLQLQQGAFFEELMQALSLPGVDARRLEIEVTESAIVSGAAMESLHGLRACGFRLAMDDFGTGFSSLGALRSLPVDRVKIDRSFISDIDQNPQTSAILASILELTRIVKLPVTVEGVEREAQLSELRALGVSSVQGFYFSRPLPPPDFARFFRNQRQAAAVAP